jgi:hypothetical protein
MLKKQVQVWIDCGLHPLMHYQIPSWLLIALKQAPAPAKHFPHDLALMQQL